MNKYIDSSIKLKNNCNHETVIEEIQTFEDGTNHLRVSCHNCKKFIKYKSQKTIDQEIFYFGKYKGENIISVCCKDYPYIEWLLENADLKPFETKNDKDS